MTTIQRRFTLSLIASAAAACAALAAKQPGPVTLRYVYKPGQTTLYAFTDNSSSTISLPGKPAATEWTQTSTGVARKTILTSSGNQGVVEETTVKGSVERTDPRGTTSQLLPAGTRRYTFDTLGKLVKMERIDSSGRADARPQPLDGFTFALPEKPVGPGAKWTETVHVVGLDGKPVAVAATSTYRGGAERAGHPASRIDVAFTGNFTAAQTGSATPQNLVNGTISGSITYYLARDLGQEVESTTDMTIAYQGSADIRNKSKDEPVRRTLRFQQSRKLTK